MKKKRKHQIKYEILYIVFKYTVGKLGKFHEENFFSFGQEKVKSAAISRFKS